MLHNLRKSSPWSQSVMPKPGILPSLGNQCFSASPSVTADVSERFRSYRKWHRELEEQRAELANSQLFNSKKKRYLDAEIQCLEELIMLQTDLTSSLPVGNVSPETHGTSSFHVLPGSNRRFGGLEANSVNTDVSSLEGLDWSAVTDLLLLSPTSPCVTYVAERTQWTLLYVSPSVKHVLGRRQTDMVGGDGWESCHPNDRHLVNRLKDNEELANEGACGLSFQYRRKRKDRTYIHVLAVGRIIGLRLFAWIEIVIDTTSKIHLEQGQVIPQRGMEEQATTSQPPSLAGTGTYQPTMPSLDIPTPSRRRPNPGHFLRSPEIRASTPSATGVDGTVPSPGARMDSNLCSHSCGRSSVAQNDYHSPSSVLDKSPPPMLKSPRHWRRRTSKDSPLHKSKSLLPRELPESLAVDGDVFENCGLACIQKTSDHSSDPLAGGERKTQESSNLLGDQLPTPTSTTGTANSKSFILQATQQLRPQRSFSGGNLTHEADAERLLHGAPADKSQGMMMTHTSTKSRRRSFIDRLEIECLTAQTYDEEIKDADTVEEASSSGSSAEFEQGRRLSRQPQSIDVTVTHTVLPLHREKSLPATVTPSSESVEGQADRQVKGVSTQTLGLFSPLYMNDPDTEFAASTPYSLGERSMGLQTEESFGPWMPRMRLASAQMISSSGELSNAGHLAKDVQAGCSASTRPSTSAVPRWGNVDEVPVWIDSLAMSPALFASCGLSEEEISVFQGLKVLLVEDDIVNRVIGRKLLEQLRCEVTELCNGKEALELLARDDQNSMEVSEGGELPARFDLVLMDLMMPVMGGQTCVERFRLWEAEQDSKRKRTLIFAVTSNTSEGDMVKCAQTGFDEFIGKPLTLMKLQSRLKKFISK